MARRRRAKKVQITGRFQAELATQIQEAAERLEWSVAEVIDECVARELPRLLQREKKRTQRGTSV